MNEFLPLGTIILLKENRKIKRTKFMIVGVNIKADDKLYDYCATVFPFGYVGADQLFLFNADKIDKIIHKGYEDEDSKELFEDYIWDRRTNGGKKDGE